MSTGEHGVASAPVPQKFRVPGEPRGGRGSARRCGMTGCALDAVSPWPLDQCSGRAHRPWTASTNSSRRGNARDLAISLVSGPFRPRCSRPCSPVPRFGVAVPTSKGCGVSTRQRSGNRSDAQVIEYARFALSEGAEILRQSQATVNASVRDVVRIRIAEAENRELLEQLRGKLSPAAHLNGADTFE